MKISKDNLLKLFLYLLLVICLQVKEVMAFIKTLDLLGEVEIVFHLNHYIISRAIRFTLGLFVMLGMSKFLMVPYLLIWIKLKSDLFHSNHYLNHMIRVNQLPDSNHTIICDFHFFVKAWFKSTIVVIHINVSLIWIRQNLDLNHTRNAKF